MRSALAYVPKGQQSMASAALRQAFIQPDLRLIGAVLLEANDKGQTQHRYMQTKARANLMAPLINATPDQTSTVAA